MGGVEEGGGRGREGEGGGGGGREGEKECGGHISRGRVEGCGGGMIEGSGGGTDRGGDGERRGKRGGVTR